VKATVRRRLAKQRADSPSVLPCACANLRRASRAVSQLYDEQVRGAGLTIAQFTLLQVLFQAGKLTQGGLGQILVLDSTTLTRTLQPLEKKGWIRRRPGKDRRERQITLTKAGQDVFQRAVPRWNRAQRILLARLGRRRWRGLMAELSHIAGMSLRA
jgi:DNA-binding MarR family transcriptional regulator